jgi:hypothetical protein
VRIGTLGTGTEPRESHSPRKAATEQTRTANQAGEARDAIAPGQTAQRGTFWESKNKMGEPNPAAEDYYVRPGVARNASDAVIKRAYKRAAMRFPPLIHIIPCSPPVVITRLVSI